jgi:hypothetical protein
MAQPGTICLSEDAYRQVRANKRFCQIGQLGGDAIPVI